MICKKCGARVPDDVAFCTRCGFAFPAHPARSENRNAPKKRSTWWLYVLLFLCAAVLIGSIAYIFTDGFLPGNRNPQADSAAAPTETVNSAAETAMPSAKHTSTPTAAPTVAPTPVPTSWSLPAGTSVEDQVVWIRGIYNEIMTGISNGSYTEKTLPSGETLYYSGNELKCASAGRGIDGNPYGRMYYYHDGKLIFAYYEADDAHRYYFYEGKLIRWRYCTDKDLYDQAVNHDLENTPEYLRYEQEVLQAGQAYLNSR